jgi:hypothetical protein
MVVQRPASLTSTGEHPDALARSRRPLPENGVGLHRDPSYGASNLLMTKRHTRSPQRCGEHTSTASDRKSRSQFDPYQKLAAACGRSGSLYATPRLSTATSD